MRSPDPAAAALELTGLTKRFGPVTAVDGLDLTVGCGEVVAFLGPNGAGKTTTVDLILGLGRPDAGTVQVLGTTPRQAVTEGRVAAVMQSGGLLADLTVAETVRYTASLFRNSRPVAEVLERAGLTDRADRTVGKCSGGEQQRLRFAMSLVPDPDLLILDEPTTGMDVEGRRQFWAAIRADAGSGRTVLFATHYLDEADRYADRIVLIRGGRLVADGTPAEIKNMASGRSVRATLPAADGAALVARLAELPGVSAVERRGEQVEIRAADSDLVARHLLDGGGHDLEITAHGLEDAFVTLTTDGHADNPADSRPTDPAGSTR